MARAPVVLIVNEHEWASRSLDTILTPRGYTVRRAYNATQAVEEARALAPDAVFIERSLPDSGGPQLCQRLREEEIISPATPVILTTSGPVTQEQRVEALRSGAWEIVTLPMDAEELVLRLQRYTRAKLEVDRAEAAARTDPETGFYNQTGILQRIHELAAAAERHGRPLACVVFEPAAESDEAVR
ncbi:MAG: response regulator, partial [Longimicrobiales bacterium]|nr:response regulator [Longimicrobiales bacterium]